MRVQPFAREVRVSSSGNGWVYRLAMRWPGGDSVTLAEGAADSREEAERGLDDLIEDIVRDLRSIRKRGRKG